MYELPEWTFSQDQKRQIRNVYGDAPLTILLSTNQECTTPADISNQLLMLFLVEPRGGFRFLLCSTLPAVTANR